VRGVGSGDATGVKRRPAVEREGGVEREAGSGRKAGLAREAGGERKLGAGQKAGGELEVGAAAEAPLVKRLPSFSGAACRLRRAAQLPGIRRIGNAGGQQHRQVNRPKNQCYRESLSWGHVRKRKCNHL